jgi:hypothetical protein
MAPTAKSSDGKSLPTPDFERKGCRTAFAADKRMVG